MSIYLSVDFDYWSGGTAENYQHMLDYSKSILENIPQIDFVIHHHDIIKYINAGNYDKIINVDFHSDLCDCFNNKKRQGIRLNEGTWANYLNDRENKEFVWVYPHKRCYHPLNLFGSEGRCDVKQNPFGKNCKDVCGYLKTSVLYRKLPKVEELKTFERACFCLSPKWCSKEQLPILYKFIRENNLIQDQNIRGKHWIKKILEG
jgi:hypothetical protein